MHDDHAHDLGNRHDASASDGFGERRTRVVVLLTAAMMVAELIVGRLTGSLALTADGWHMATHVGALSLAALGYWYARSAAARGRLTFGGGKVYALAGYTSALLLALVAVWMGVESVRRFATPLAIRFGDALPVAVLGLLVNLASIALLHHDEEHADDHNLRAAYLHVLADALTSVLAIVALLAGRYFGVVWLDPAMGIVGGAVILRWSWSLCVGSARVLLDALPAGEIDRRVRSALEAIDDVRVVDLHVWDLGPGRRSCVVALFTATPRATAVYRDSVMGVERFAHVTIEVNRCEQERGTELSSA